MKVWIIESGDYEQRHVEGVAVSVATAVEFLKMAYGPPYLVAWEEVRQTDPYVFELTGHFEAVQHYSIKHDCTFEIEEYELQGSPIQ